MDDIQAGFQLLHNPEPVRCTSESSLVSLVKSSRPSMHSGGTGRCWGDAGGSKELCVVIQLTLGNALVFACRRLWTISAYCAGLIIRLLMSAMPSEIGKEALPRRQVHADPLQV